MRRGSDGTRVRRDHRVPRTAGSTAGPNLRCGSRKTASQVFASGVAPSGSSSGAVSQTQAASPLPRQFVHAPLPPKRAPAGVDLRRREDIARTAFYHPTFRPFLHTFCGPVSGP